MMLRCLEFFLLFFVSVFIVLEQFASNHRVYLDVAFSNSPASHDNLEMRSLILLGNCLMMLCGWLDLVLI